MSFDLYEHNRLDCPDDFIRCDRANVPFVIIPTSLVYQITFDNTVFINRNLDTIVHVASNQNKIDEIKRRIEELEFNKADMHDEFTELHELFVKCTPLRHNKAADKLANEYRNRMVEITNTFNSRKTELIELNQQLLLEQQKSILEHQANPSILLSGEEIVANYLNSEIEIEL